MKIVISPYSKKLREKDTLHPKNFPFWKELVDLLKIDGHKIIQVGVEGEEKLVEDCKFNLSSKELIELYKQCDTFISVENFFPHFVHANKLNGGVVIFAQSDPEIFGYSENINLLKSKEYLRWDQFGPWEACEYKEDAFVKPDMVLTAIQKINLEKT